MSRSLDERAGSVAGIHAGSPGVFAALNRFVVQPLLTLHRHRVGRRELMALDDRQLEDIGIRRHEIELALTQPHRIVRPTTPASAVNTNRRSETRAA